MTNEKATNSAASELTAGLGLDFIGLITAEMNKLSERSCQAAIGQSYGASDVHNRAGNTWLADSWPKGDDWN